MRSPESARPAPLVQLITTPSGPWSELARALERLDCEVTCSPDPDADGLRAPELVLLDLGRPASEGRDRARDIQGLARSGAAGVIALVRGGDHAAIRRAYDSGAIDFIDDHENLESAVERVRFALRTVSRLRTPRDTSGDDRDGLTGLPSRPRFLRLLATSIVRARTAQRCVAVLCFDLDRFRHVTGSLQHSQTDELVLAVAQRLDDACRERDVLSRMGLSVDENGLARVSGEEFTLLLEGLIHVEDAAKVGRRMLDLIAAPFSIAGQEIYLTMTVGIASFPSEGSSAEGLLKSAETAAYCAKQSGPNALQFYSPAMNARAFERLTLETSLRHAIERDELVVYYQPRIAIATGRTVGVEALVRWRHPQFGMVSPAQFIPLAEETGLIVPLGEWVLRQACEQTRDWHARGLTQVKVSVNVSPVQFRQPDLFASVMRTLAKTGLDARWLELEPTETSLMQNFDAVVSTLSRFKDAGIGVSVDDFGTGYSSLSYLRKFPLDSLKIDQSFLREVTTNQDDASIVTAIMLMGKSLKLRLVAEGVETPGQLAFLRIMQCDEAQGFLFSPALPADAVERFLIEPSTAAA